MARLTINGRSLEVNVDPNTPLLWAIREQVGLTGTKYGCGVAMCGACTVHLDGKAVRSCVLPVASAEGKKITTIEGLANGGVLHKVQKAWVDYDVPQCGYCQAGMIMAVAALLKDKPKPTDADIDAGISKTPKIDRRSFVIGTAAVGAGLTLGLKIPFGASVVRAQDGAPEINAWVVIRPDDTVVVRVARSEMGQGTLTGL